MGYQLLVYDLPNDDVLVRLVVLAIELLLKPCHAFLIVHTYVIRVIKDGYYPHDTLVYNLPFLEGDTSGHVIDRSSIRMGDHLSPLLEQELP